MQNQDAVRASLEELLSRSGWANLTDDDLWREHELGNGMAMVLLRARAALDPKGRAAELISPILPNEPVGRTHTGRIADPVAVFRGDQFGGFRP